jgi:rhodanese-related sulfurtransferase
LIFDWLFGSRERLANVSVVEAAELLRLRHVLVDVREDFEFAAESILGARSLPLSKLRKGFVELESAESLLVICRSGHRSPIAARMLARQGFTVTNVEGGLNAWRRAGLPVEGRQKKT